MEGPTATASLKPTYLHDLLAPGATEVVKELSRPRREAHSNSG
ncbi:hypothetical protein EKD16_18390 [Streptomonospora litoralis]|uniref:Uncharacterized protein n=1 Tax=Streptomonospora litoralis TaxID=2498135 RepID=A0A4V0ZK19_9ACTN|nr:hypothetical protein EKD16_18390 [Streptomonospora litoralis]